MTIKEGPPRKPEKKRRDKKDLAEELKPIEQDTSLEDPSVEPLSEEMQVDSEYVNTLSVLIEAVAQHIEDSLPRIAKMWNAIHIFLGDANIVFDSISLEKYEGIDTIPAIERGLSSLLMDFDEDEYGEPQDRVTPALLLILNGESEIILYSRVTKQEVCVLNESDIVDQTLWEDSEALKSTLAQLVAMQFQEQVKYAQRYKELTEDDLDPKIAQFLRSVVDPKPPRTNRKTTSKKKK